MINYYPVFVDEEHKVVSPPPVVDQISPDSLRPWLSPGFPPVSLVNPKIASHLDIISDRIGFSETPHNNLPGVGRMSKLRPQRLEDSVQFAAMTPQVLVIRSIRQMPPPLSQFLILINQGDGFLVQSLALTVGLIRARSR